MRDEILSYSMADGQKAGTIILKLAGPLTLSNLFDLQGELRAITPELLVFDLSESPYMDSAGLGVVVNYYVSAQKRGHRMALAGVNHRIAALLGVTRVDNLLRCYATVAAAEAEA